MTLQPFDAALASGTVVTARSEEIVDLLVVSHAPERIEAYRAAMTAGARFPPVSVVRLAGRYVLADGHKRLAAARALGDGTIPIEVWSWARWSRDQFRQAAGHARKTARVVALAPTRPREAATLAFTTVEHWGRVARSLAVRARAAFTR